MTKQASISSFVGDTRTAEAPTEAVTEIGDQMKFGGGILTAEGE